MQGHEGEWRRGHHAPGRPALGHAPGPLALSLRGGGSGGETGDGDKGATAVTPGMESACVVGERGSLSLPAMRDAMLGTSSEKCSIL
jgi:hypothetical protein